VNLIRRTKILRKKRTEVDYAEKGGSPNAIYRQIVKIRPDGERDSSRRWGKGMTGSS